MKHLMPNDPRHEISGITGGHFKRFHKQSPHRSRDVPLRLHCQHRQCSLHIPLRLGPTCTSAVVGCCYGDFADARIKSLVTVHFNYFWNFRVFSG
jgi:hypothetical protein